MNTQEMRDRLRDFVRSELLREPDYPLAAAEPLITGGLIDSFSLGQIGVFVEDAFGVYVPDMALTVANMDTIERMVTGKLKARP